MSDEIESFVGTLLEAVRTRTATTPFTDTRELDETTALQVQDAVVRARIDAGNPLMGAKLGLTSKAKMTQMKVDRPLYGWLTTDMQVDAGQTVRCEAAPFLST